MHLNELRGVCTRLVACVKHSLVQHVLTVNLAKPSKVNLPADSRIPIWETEVCPCALRTVC